VRTGRDCDEFLVDVSSIGNGNDTNDSQKRFIQKERKQLRRVANWSSEQ
jgi:hypothetical protein